MADFAKVYEHCIDLSQYRDAGLTVDIVRKGLADYVVRPQLFIETLTGCVCRTVAGDVEDVFERELTFGKVKVTDTTRLTESGLRTMVPKQGEITPSCFEIELVDDERGFYLVFSYSEEPIAGVSDNAQIHGLRQQAWLMKDRDIVDRILQRL